MRINTHGLTTPLLALTLTAPSGAMTRAVTSVPAPVPAAEAARLERGAYLVKIMGRNDCHTPLKLGPRGPEPDLSRALTGHPADMIMPPAPALHGPWMWAGGATNVFAGPWGVSFTANLRPDVETGLGKWTEGMFIATMKTGRHQACSSTRTPPRRARS